MIKALSSNASTTATIGMKNNSPSVACEPVTGRSKSTAERLDLEVSDVMRPRLFRRQPLQARLIVGLLGQYGCQIHPKYVRQT